jgi:glycosyltransferase involved in cell wall biosynthesis
MLGIATPTPNSPTETFIQQHISRIAPGNTVVLYFENKGSMSSITPSLRILDNKKVNWLEGQIRSSVNALLYGYPGAISGHTGIVLKEFLAKHQVQSILAEFGPTGCALFPICRELGIRLVVNFHGHDATVMPKRWVIRRAYQRLNKHADAFVCGSKYFSEILINLGFDEQKIHIIPCGIEVDQFDMEANKDPNLVIAVGRFIEKKAPHLTIQAFKMVLDKCPNARLEMIGDGPLMHKCQRIVNKEGLGEKVILYGAKSHEFVKQRLAVASLFVQHSVIASNGDTESQGISLLEAMASEIPVISTRHNGFVETVIEGVTGFLVAERDVDAMADRMVQVLQDKKLRDSFGQAGRKHVEENYKAEKMVQRLQDLLEL